MSLADAWPRIGRQSRYTCSSENYSKLDHANSVTKNGTPGLLLGALPDPWKQYLKRLESSCTFALFSLIGLREGSWRGTDDAGLQVLLVMYAAAWGWRILGLQRHGITEKDSMHTSLPYRFFGAASCSNATSSTIFWRCDRNSYPNHQPWPALSPQAFVC